MLMEICFSEKICEAYASDLMFLYRLSIAFLIIQIPVYGLYDI